MTTTTGSYCTGYASTSSGVQPSYPSTVIVPCSCPGNTCSTTASAALASWLLAVIIIGVILFIVLPILLVIAICCCGFALCGYNQRRAGNVIVMQGAPPTGMYVQSSPQMQMQQMQMQPQQMQPQPHQLAGGGAYASTYDIPAKSTGV